MRRAVESQSCFDRRFHQQRRKSKSMKQQGTPSIGPGVATVCALVDCMSGILANLNKEKMNVVCPSFQWTTFGWAGIRRIGRKWSLKANCLRCRSKTSTLATCGAAWFQPRAQTTTRWTSSSSALKSQGTGDWCWSQTTRTRSSPSRRLWRKASRRLRSSWRSQRQETRRQTALVKLPLEKPKGRSRLWRVPWKKSWGFRWEIGIRFLHGSVVMLISWSPASEWERTDERHMSVLAADGGNDHPSLLVKECGSSLWRAIWKGPMTRCGKACSWGPMVAMATHWSWPRMVWSRVAAWNGCRRRNAGRRKISIRCAALRGKWGHRSQKTWTHQ